MMKKNMWIQIVCVMLLGLFLTACSTAEDLDGTSWDLESYRNSGGAMVDILPDTIVTANFQEDQVWGDVTCNNYSGSYKTTRRKISIGPLAATLRMCVGPEGIMEQEAAFLKAFEAATRFEIDGDILELENAQGVTILVFNRSEME